MREPGVPGTLVRPRRLAALGEEAMEDAARPRVEVLERLVSELRHDLRGAISPAALVADRLRQNADPGIQRSGRTIGLVVDRVLAILDATCQIVPPRAAQHDGPVLGDSKRRTD